MLFKFGDQNKPHCPWCARQPDHIDKFVEMVVQDNYKNATEAMMATESTYNPAFNLFCCHDCYEKMSRPFQSLLDIEYRLYKRLRGGAKWL